MSANPAVLEAALASFRAAGLKVSAQGQFLVLHDVPLVDSQRHIQLVRLITRFIHTDTTLSPPENHQVWLDGEMPCLADGGLMGGIGSAPHQGELAPGLPASFYLSNKPAGYTADANHFDQLMRYYRLFRDQAAVLDPNVDSLSGSTTGSITLHEEDSPFVYPDSCSVRADCVMVSQQLAHGRVAIIGLGGTGGYVLDQVAKTPVREIHLFDGDTFDMHNAFRAPGAATESDFGKPKVEYFKAMYSNMHKSIRVLAPTEN